MARNGSGTFNRLYSWQSDAANNVRIRADRMDAEDSGFATGLTDSIAKDGQTTPTANLPMGGFLHTGVGAATALTHYAKADQVVNSALEWGGTAGGTANAIILSPPIAPSAYVAGQKFRFLVSATNTSKVVTVNVSGLGVASIKDLSIGSLIAGRIAEIVYDGSNFLLSVPKHVAFFEDYAIGGADIGDGVVDAGPSVQAALNSGEKVLRCRPGSIYRFPTAGVKFPSGIRLIGDGAIFVRDHVGGPGTSALFENDTARSTWSNADIELINVRIRNLQRGPGIRMIGVDNLIVTGLNYLMDIPFDPLNPVGASSLEISGANVQVYGNYINSFLGDKWSDGIHVTQVNGCIIRDNIILAGDDGVALSFRPGSWETRGKAEVSTGVMVTNNVCQSAMADPLRIGADSIAMNGQDSHPDQSWQDVTVHGMHIYGSRTGGGRFVAIDDRRETVTIPNGEIRVGNIRSIDTGTGGQIGIFGNQDITSATYAGQRNFKNITLYDCRIATDDIGTTFYGGGVDRLEIVDTSFESLTPETAARNQFYEIGELIHRDCTFLPDTTGGGLQFTRVMDFLSIDSIYDGRGNAYSVLDWNTAPGGQKFRMYGGEVRDGTALVRVTGSDTFAERIVHGTRFTGAGSVDFSAVTATVDIYAPLDHIPSSAGTTGGTGSAGAGKQHVQISIGGTTYKLLHDGTV